MTIVSGADNGTMCFWDWKTGYNFQKFQAPVQPGSLDSEAGIFQMKFDHSGEEEMETLFYQSLTSFVVGLD